MPPRVPLLVALALLLPLAGCSAAGSLRLTAVDDAGLAREASRGLPAADEPPAAEYRAIVVGAVENGSATATGTSPPLDPDGLPFAVDGAFYDLSVEPVANHTETRVSLEVDYNGSVDGPAVAYEDLPPADRLLVDAVLPPRYDRRTEGYDFGAGALYSDEAVAASVLLGGDYAAVRFDGERYPVRVEEGRRVTVTRYRYAATRVAPDASAYAASLRNDYLFRLSGLSSGEREVIATAIEDTYYAESTGDDAFRSLAKRFRARDAVTRDEYGGSWVVRYRGTVYWADLDYGGFTFEDAGDSGAGSEDESGA